MRTPFVAANWKMHKTIAEAVDYARTFRSHVTEVTGVEMVLAPPFTALRAVRDALEGSAVHVAAQDLHWAASGAFTGEVSADVDSATIELAEVPTSFSLDADNKRMVGLSFTRTPDG